MPVTSLSVFGSCPAGNLGEPGLAPFGSVGQVNAFAFFSELPPRPRGMAVHEAGDRYEYIEHAWIVSQTSNFAELPMELDRIFAGQLRGSIDANQPQIIGDRRSHVGQIGELVEFLSGDFRWVHRLVLNPRDANMISQS